MVKISWKESKEMMGKIIIEFERFLIEAKI